MNVKVQISNKIQIPNCKELYVATRVQSSVLLDAAKVHPRT
jgi:hypothetical protein